MSAVLDMLPLSEAFLNEVRDNGYISSDHVSKFNEILARNSNFRPQEALLMWNLLSEVRPVLEPHIQILPSYATEEVTHWVCTFFDGNVIRVYDSLSSSDGLSSEQINFLHKLFPHQPPVIYEKVQRQENAYDCGVFAIAFAVSVANGLNPKNLIFDTRLMRSHLIKIFQNGTIEPFPTECTSASLKKKGRPPKSKVGRPKALSTSRKEQMVEARKRYRVTKVGNVKKSVKKYKESNPEIQKDAVEKYKRNNPEIQRDAVLKYQKANPDIVKSAKLKYDGCNPKIQKDAVEKYKRNNPEIQRGAVLKYQKANPDIVKNAKLKYDRCNPKIQKDAVEKYKRNNPEIQRDAVLKYQKSNPDIVKNAILKYHRGNPQIVRDAVKRYRKANPEINRNAVHRYQVGNPEVVRNAKNKFAFSHSLEEAARKRKAYSLPKSLGNVSKMLCLGRQSDKDFNQIACITLKYKSLLDPKCHKCRDCMAILFEEEKGRKEWCCGSGRYFLGSLPSLDAPFYTNNTFLKNSRSYNNIFAFSALGVSHGFKQVSDKKGPCLVKIQGRTYHRLFSLDWKEETGVNNVALYIDDGTERKRIAERRKLDLNIVREIEDFINKVNPIAPSLRQLSKQTSEEACIIFEKTDRRTHGPILGERPRLEEIAAIVRAGPGSEPRKVMIWKHSKESPSFISIFSETYEALQYPILFPHGTSGWHKDFQDRDGKKLSQVKYYRRLLLSESRFTDSRRLGQEYFVDMFSRVEEERLLWHKFNQSKYLRVASREELDETIAAEGGPKIGKVYLPSSFTHSPRYMKVKMQNGMALVSRKGRPSFFITLTCNPNWVEIQESLGNGQTALDRPDLCNRVFQLKLAAVMRLISSGKLFGKVIYLMYVIEFQKRGLPHAHIALKVQGEPKDIADIDNYIRATIPTEDEADGRLRKLVVQHMLHGPCGVDKPNAPCMDSDRKNCSKGFPKPSCEVTYVDDRGYVHYKRCCSNNFTLKSGRVVNDNWVVPYCPAMLLLLECHCNVEIACSVKIVKYLFKYIHKGPDHARVAVVPGDVENLNEIEEYVSLRYISASEAIWRILEFDVSHCYPTVLMLPVHLPNKESVIFQPGREVEALETSTSKLILYFQRPRLLELQDLTYLDFYEIYIVGNKPRDKSKVPVIPHPSGRHWISKRVIGKCVVRLQWLLPMLGEVYYLRMLLMKFPAYSYEDLKIVDEHSYETFQEAAYAHGLLDSENEYREALDEGSIYKTGPGLRQLFSCLVVCGAPAALLWREFKNQLAEDYLDKDAANTVKAYNSALLDIQNRLRSHGKTLEEVGLPSATDDSTETGREVMRWPKEELDLLLEQWLPMLNRNQKEVFNHVCRAIANQTYDNNMLFIDGPSGTGKTLLLNVITASLRRQEYIVLCTASTGIAALNHKGGVTAHSMFRLPLDYSEPNAYCDLKSNSERAELIRRSSLIIWDEVSMAQKQGIETLERTLRDICGNEQLFGGKLILFAGDFRQIAPIVKGGSLLDSIKYSIKFSYLWRKVKVFHLLEQIRSKGDEAYSKFILEVGEDKVGNVSIDNVEVIPLNTIQVTEGLDNLISFVYPNEILTNQHLCCKRAILAGTNSCIDEINLIVLNKMEGDLVHLYSADSLETTAENNDREFLSDNFLNSISEPGIPEHMIVLKIGAVCILLRNISFDDGLVNGTKVIIKNITRRLIEAYVSGEDKLRTVFIPRICFKFQAGRSGLTILRRQFPIKLAYAMTINKSQGQTLDMVGLDLRNDVFAHGQLYVALGRVRSNNAIRVLLKKNRISLDNVGHSVNIVHTQLL